MKIEHSRRARPGYELNCDAELTPIFYFRGGEKIQLTAPCWPRVPTAGVQCPVSGLCHCWGRGQNFPHYRQNYFPNTLISTCPALILLLKSDKSSQMLHCTVRPVSKIDLLVESILRTAEQSLSRSAHETNNKQSTVHPFRDRSNDDHALKVATIQFMDLEIHFVSPSCWLPKPKQFEV